MVLVTLGTQDKKFPRLLEIVEKLINKGIINEEVVAQVGSTKYKSNKMKIIKYMSEEEMLKYIKNSSYIIGHGGVGTIMSAINLGKKIIVVPRLKKYKEHVNDHQLDIVSEFSKLNLIIDGSNDIEDKVKNINRFKVKKIESNTDNFINFLEDYIDNN